MLLNRPGRLPSNALHAGGLWRPPTEVLSDVANCGDDGEGELKKTGDESGMELSGNTHWELQPALRAALIVNYAGETRSTPLLRRRISSALTH